MAKKRKQKSVPKVYDSFLLPKSMDYSDPRKLEAMIKKTFSASVDNLRRMEKEKPGMVAAMDMDTQRCKRRVQAAAAYAPRIRELVQDICPDVPDLFSIEEEWAYINSLPTTSYDQQEERQYLVLGAAIWMLDRIKESGRIQEAIPLLPRDDDSLEDVYIPDIYDPVHSEEVILSMVYVIQQRNKDCMVPGQKKIRKNQKYDPADRMIVDSFTTLRLHHQEVPSRERFEKLLSMIDKEAIDKAVAHYEAKLFAWMECYYRCRAVYCKKQLVLEQRRKRFMTTIDVRMKELREKTDGKQNSILSEVQDPIEQMMLSDGPASQGHFDFMVSEPFQLLQYFETETQKLEEELNQLSLEITKFIYHSRHFGTVPKERIKTDYGEEIADIISEFTFCDPYEMCFALLYLMETDSELPWLYYPGIVLSENAGAMLPWSGEEYDEMEDAHWDEYYGAEPRASRQPVKNVPELADWYRLDYIYQNNDSDYQFRYNLAQIVYEVSGGILPRNLHRYDDGIKYLRLHGITGKKMQIPLLYCMMLLGEGRHRSKDWRLRFNVPDSLMDDLVNTVVGTVKEGISESIEAHASAEDLQARVDALKNENDQLKRAAYEAERNVKELQKKNETLLGKSQAERRELAELREIVFLRENDREAEIEEDHDEATFPYTVKQSVVVFGGHETWAKAIRPMLTGDIRFVDRGMRPDADLIRHADMVWIQPNSLSHGDYYKIIRIIRTRNIPLHYFKFASAEKCALQLAAEDMKY